MPQLGMAQDSGIIVSWLKKPGDPVRSADILMEVETDKATMEVEAGHDGFLTEIRAEAGSDVPIGDVIAVISDRPDAVVADNAPAVPISVESKSSDNAKVQVEPARQTPEIAPPKPVSGVAISPSADRILASPKARRLANERGIDLRRLARQGVDQPFHVADLDRLDSRIERGGAVTIVTAKVKRKDFMDFADWASKESDGAATRATILLAFASGALRDSQDSRSEIHAAHQVFHGGEKIAAIDADLQGIARIETTEAAPAVDLSVIDLIDTALDGYSGQGSDAEVTFVVASNGKKKLRLTLQFHGEFLPPAHVAELMNGFARRVAEPLRHLL